jgi:ferric-dicitrate binding protein FerR (iron transport regulator)
MSAEKGHPSRDDLLVMAFVDDELVDEVREEFQARLARDPELARQVSEYQRLDVVARQCAPPEPADYEWARMQDDDGRRALLGLGWIAMFMGGVGLIGWLSLEVYKSDVSSGGKYALSALLVGFTILLMVKLRDRMRLLPYDPYTEVKR